MVGLVILTTRFEATRGLFWDGLCSFERGRHLSLLPLSELPRHINGREFGHNGLFIPADLQRNPVLILESSDPKAKTLPLGHRGLLSPWFQMIIANR
ncbi:hypothetical protein AVEN_37793-1 [Araneus ventricosus]|uniref:Uncharacterized protein n=1 Tax=Araneus ventricosus TaxID=182803 RepID=A0A4Y2W952_ARAVE|nr:hypothetical protein AVEN_37793-1 [Araneus ventricosus]